jgi:hypothetical protein
MVERGRQERLQIMLAEGELAAIDDWRFARRMPSRASAIRELIKRGLDAEGFQFADSRAKSKEFGVIVAERAKGEAKSRAR